MIPLKTTCLYIILIAVACIGCAHTADDRVKASPSPTLGAGAGFRTLSECPIDVFEYLVEKCAAQRMNVGMSILDTFNRRFSTSEVSNHVASVRARLTTHQPAEVELLNELKQEFQDGRERLFYYYQTNATAWEEGWLIIMSRCDPNPTPGGAPSRPGSSAVPSKKSSPRWPPT
jgi:hypothetical protein